MNEYKKSKQEFHDSGEMKSHTEIKETARQPSPHMDILNMTISVILTITAVYVCCTILVGTMVKINEMTAPKQEQAR